MKKEKIIFLSIFLFLKTEVDTSLVPSSAAGNKFYFILFRTLLHQYFCAKKLQSQTVIREKLHKALKFQKGTSKMLMKLTVKRGGGVLTFNTEYHGLRK